MIYTLTLIHWYNSYQVQLVVQAAPEAPSNRPMISKITSRWRWWSTRWWCWWWWWWWCRKISFKPAKKLAHWWCHHDVRIRHDLCSVQIHTSWAFCHQPLGVGDGHRLMHRLHDVLQFFETSLKHRIVKKWKTSFKTSHR